MQRLTNPERPRVARLACTDARDDETPCRMFLCARCRRQVLVCRRCDRGQIYCAGTCAGEARREAQRAARRRHQATPHGRTTHAERNRRYRARRRCVTDHGLSTDVEAARLRRSAIDVATDVPMPARRLPSRLSCHYCGHSPSLFVRLSPLRPRSCGRRIVELSRGCPRPP